MNISLVGLMGAGKSSIGKALAEKLNMTFVDIDKLIEDQEGISINEIFSNSGEKYFRELETQIIKKICSKDNQVIATGGGAIQNDVNLATLKQNSKMFYLEASVEILYERIKHKTNRPLLKVDNPMAKLNELLLQREENYIKADIIINTENKTIEEKVLEIAESIN